MVQTEGMVPKNVRTTRHDAASGAQREFGEQACGADELIYFHVLDEAVKTLDACALPYVLIGGAASSEYGRPRWTHDIDLLVMPHHAEQVLVELEQRGFVSERTDHRWIYKAYKNEVMVDVLFRSKGAIYLDDNMIARATFANIGPARVRLIPPEDLVIMKAVAHDEATPRHWHDALGILARTELDWDYLVRRSIRAPRRVLSLLLYAQSTDIFVPNQAVSKLFHKTYGSY